MNKSEFYYQNMENFISCDVDIKTETQQSDSNLFPLDYEYNYINNFKPPLKQFKKIITDAPPQHKQRVENRERMRRFRLNLPEVEKQIRRQQNAQHMREFRKKLPEVEKQIRRQKAAEYMREFRRNLSEIERQVRRKIDTERMRKFRSNLTEVEKESRRQKAKERMRQQREEIRMRNLARMENSFN